MHTTVSVKLINVFLVCPFFFRSLLELRTGSMYTIVRQAWELKIIKINHLLHKIIILSTHNENKDPEKSYHSSSSLSRLKRMKDFN
jgi:hypothetical protein